MLDLGFMRGLQCSVGHPLPLFMLVVHSTDGSQWTYNDMSKSADCSSTFSILLLLRNAYIGHNTE